MRYQSLTFQLHEAGGALRLQMSGAGEAGAAIDKDALLALITSKMPAEAIGLLPEVETGVGSGAMFRDVRARNPQETFPDPGEIGRSLFDLLFVGAVRDLFCAQLSQLKAGERGLRLRLSLDLSQSLLRSLQELPWELLWYPAFSAPLALDRRFSLVRSLDVPLPIPQGSSTEALRCLVAGASPVGCEKLDIRGEMERISRSLEGQETIRASYLRAAGPQSLRQRLLEWPCEILHFAGHGYDEQRPGLFLEDEAKEAVRVDAQEWAELVADLPIRLIVLNACSTAKNAGTARQPFLGVAQALIRAGIPAVLAMREPIPDMAGLSLAKVLFARLAAGDPLEAAVVEARKALRSGERGQGSWWIPALFLRGNETLLFPMSESPGALRSGTSLAGTARAGSVGGTSQSIVGVELAAARSPTGNVEGKAEVDRLEGSSNSVVGVRIS